MASFDPMKQASLDLNLIVRKTRKQVFLDQMDKVIPWDELVDLIAPNYSEGKVGRPPFALQTMLCTLGLRPKIRARRVAGGRVKRPIPPLAKELWPFRTVKSFRGIN